MTVLLAGVLQNYRVFLQNEEKIVTIFFCKLQIVLLMCKKTCGYTAMYKKLFLCNQLHTS